MGPLPAAGQWVKLEVPASQVGLEGSGVNWRGYYHDSYGLCIDSKGNIWNTAVEWNQIRKFAPDGTLLGTFDHGYHWAQGASSIRTTTCGSRTRTTRGPSAA